MKINLFIFDWSGVISDDRKPVYEANMRLLRDYNIPMISFDEWLPKTTMTAVEFLENFGVYGEPERLFSLYEKYLNEAKEAGVMPVMYLDVPDVLQHLKNEKKKIAVLSSHPFNSLEKEAEDYGLEKFFDLMVGDSRDKVSGLRGICENLDENFELTLYIGDTIYDIRAAKQAGVHSAAVCQSYHTRERLMEEKPEFLLESLADLITAI